MKREFLLVSGSVTHFHLAAVINESYLQSIVAFPTQSIDLSMQSTLGGSCATAQCKLHELTTKGFERFFWRPTSLETLNTSERA